MWAGGDNHRCHFPFGQNILAPTWGHFLVTLSFQWQSLEGWVKEAKLYHIPQAREPWSRHCNSSLRYHQPTSLSQIAFWDCFWFSVIFIPLGFGFLCQDVLQLLGSILASDQRTSLSLTHIGEGTAWGSLLGQRCVPHELMLRALTLVRLTWEP